MSWDWQCLESNSLASTDLHQHGERMATSAEILLLNYYEHKENEIIRAREAKINGKIFLENNRKYIEVVKTVSKTEPETEAAVLTVVQTKQQETLLRPKSPEMLPPPSPEAPPPDDEMDELNNKSIVKDTKPEIKKRKNALIDDTTLPQHDNTTVAPTIKKIKKRDKSEIIQNVVVQIDNTTVFSPQGILFQDDWNPISATGPLHFTLPSFSYNGNNTLAFTVYTSANFKGWAFNICPDDHKDFCDYFFHFNPRYIKRSQSYDLVTNDKFGTWGAVYNDPFNADGDPLDERMVEVIVNIRPEGFFVYTNNKFRIFFCHRRSMEENCNLTLLIPERDENTKLYDGVIRKVWWGNTSLASSEYEIAIVNSSLNDENSLNRPPLVPFMERTAVAKDLPIITDPMEIQVLEINLKEMFSAFHFPKLSVVIGKGLAYVRFDTVEYMQQAIEEYKYGVEMAPIGESNTDQVNVVSVVTMKEFLNLS